jgi:uncharacterized membrane protein HdeD (DUF308 family)
MSTTPTPTPPPEPTPSTPIPIPLTPGALAFRELRHELQAIRGNWFWFVLLGIGLIVLGFIALSSYVIASIATAIGLGAIVLTSGLFEAVGSFWCRAWSGFFIHLLWGVLGVVVGVLMLRQPVQALAIVTILLASFFLVSGIFEIVSAVAFRFSQWGWALVSGVVNVALGLLIWNGWPASALWVPGTFLGISLIFRGASWISLALAVKSMPLPHPHGHSTTTTTSQGSPA